MHVPIYKRTFKYTCIYVYIYICLYLYTNLHTQPFLPHIFSLCLEDRRLLSAPQSVEGVFWGEAEAMMVGSKYQNSRGLLVVPGSINSHYFHIIGDGKLNPIVGVYIPITRIPIKGGRFPIPYIGS